MPQRDLQPAEYAPFYSTYIDQVPAGSVLDTLIHQRETTREFLSHIPEAAADYSYAPEKWSIRDVVGHMIDTERIFAFRALHFARSAEGAIPGMDQDTFASNATYASRSLKSLADEFHLLRGANTRQFSTWDKEVLDRDGVASGVRFTVRALLHIMAGHELHHVRILKERYL